MEVHALVNGRVSDLPSLLKEVTSLSELVHLDAQLQERSHKRVPNSSVFLFIKFNMHLKKKKKKNYRQWNSGSKTREHSGAK